MNKSLQDQLLGAGLIDSKKAKKISKESRKAKKVQNKNKDDSISEAQAAALKAKQEKVERDNELNKQRNLQAEKKALSAQIAQMINHYKLQRDGGEQEYNFSDGNKIKKIRVSQGMLNEITRGRLCIARLGEAYELIPKPVADKIRERDESIIVVYNEKPTAKADNNLPPATDSDEDYYAQFEIPDDLMW